ncbi:glycosyltransferase family 2 protein [Dialister pneumosintes]|uniref:Glycosyltransferase family 2 protein n=1 Tax=Dialister pneumosintes TaxID=39950 RepID=A0ABX9ME04_9FIRM|nr:glycosyltransferase family 2 protein [Dialister pneumosintes]RID95082.1 glycosyltransferase family 2 protein [Dialister pneumosintes]
MYKPLISVIVPVYKVEKHIHRCIESVLKQTYANWELILVDDGSPDSCGRICDAYAARYDNILVIHQENQGLSAARNAGLDRAGGEWVYFLDSDDFIREDTLEKIELFF